ncbi:hypothetical protein BC477_06885 [Clavibacter michiganensis subsp. michiganensis]|uniref:Uncharacterized protein n=1 Tax=Clavibacter michiganensis subsp. michiganensis TaxID=33013 RepID=A0A251XLT4_CLAMM|nr:hypothetical protein BC477_06885 [Clavibacter michiganensis subsp. michiganensis]OUE04444.1 hypothetical protein CMMCAS07_05815 [Clavibacter michiganensis subsp. michiganensis]
MAKLLTPAASSSEPMAFKSGTRMRCSSIPRVRSFGTSRYRVPVMTPLGSTRLMKPCSCGVIRSSAVRAASTFCQIA